MAIWVLPGGLHGTSRTLTTGGLHGTSRTLTTGGLQGTGRVLPGGLQGTGRVLPGGLLSTGSTLGTGGLLSTGSTLGTGGLQGTWPYYQEYWRPPGYLVVRRPRGLLEAVLDPCVIKDLHVSMVKYGAIFRVILGSVEVHIGSY